jgi:short-subunit dehydrogenase
MNILISGGSRGIGKETALHLAGNKDNKIIITGRNEEALRRICKNAEYQNISFILLDLENFRHNEDSFKKQVLKNFESIDILINNAGTLTSERFMAARESDIRTMMETNFFAPAALIRSLLHFMKKGSHIVNISSMGGYLGSVKFAGLSYYSASKAAIACLSECLALEFKDYGISVNCLALGSVATEMIGEAFPGYKAPVSPEEMGEFIAGFAINGNKVFNGKVIPVALSTP